MTDRASTIAGRFAPTLVAWQRVHGRHTLPWQQLASGRDAGPGAGRDAYGVWVAEIMLQQTQVAAVIPFYRRFLERFPDVTALAEAPLDEVMRCWSGLGYYSRARNLHAAAGRVVSEFAGVFPDDLDALERLPGVGRSTAAAIAVFAFGLRAAILDGNVKRVLARVFAIEGVPSNAVTTRGMWSLAAELLPARGVGYGGEGDIGHYSQGLMDLGATVCTPRNPSCRSCPFETDCLAYRQGRVAELPHRARRKALPERRVTMLLITRGNEVLLERRPPTGIWGGLWSLPEAQRVDDLEQFRGRFERFGDLLSIEGEPGFTHRFTHFVLHADVVHARLRETPHEGRQPHLASPEEPLRWVDETDVLELGLPAPIRTLMRVRRADDYRGRS